MAIVVNFWEASAFVTDGAGQAEAFTGAAGRSMTLEGANGAQLSASFGLEGFEGHVALEDGSGFDFLASEATGLAGVYDVEIGDSYIAGTADHGATLTGGIAHRLEDGSLLVQGISTRPGSRSRSLRVRLAPSRGESSGGSFTKAESSRAVAVTARATDLPHRSTERTSRHSRTPAMSSPSHRSRTWAGLPAQNQNEPFEFIRATSTEEFPMTYAPVANFYACRISRRAMVASEPTWKGRTSAIESMTDVAESLIEHGRTFIKSGEGMALRVAIVIGAGQACAFVTNGAGRSQFFTGKAAGSLILDSVDGSRLVASSRSDVQECWLSRPGTSTAVLSFKAEPSDGCAGLYRVEIGNGGVRGVDGNGNMLRGDIEGVLSDGTLVVNGTVSLVTGDAEQPSQPS
ncbi:MAG: hypothetical protein R2845_12895 [Thermomicrobiales bacterium]